MAIAEAVHAEIERTNREVPSRAPHGDQRLVEVTSSGRSTRCSEHVYLGAFLVVGIIFVFLRDCARRSSSALSIPISVIGTFALLYFAGFTLNTMTFGGLALGVGMIVDASIVVLENTFRHMEHGKPRLQASIEGAEEVWSAILASIAHAHRRVRAAAVPERRVEHPLRAALGRRHVLADDVAVRRGHDRAGALLAPAEACRRRMSSAPASSGRLFTVDRTRLEPVDDGYQVRRSISRSSTVRPSSPASRR